MTTSMRFPDDLPGNEEHLSSRALVERAMLQRGIELARLEHYVSWRGGRSLYVYQIDMRKGSRLGDEALVVLKAIKDGEPSIAFSSGPSLIDALLVAGRRAIAGKLNWREDERPTNKLEEIRAAIEEYVGLYG